jgi:hypothetical protein
LLQLLPQLEHFEAQPGLQLLLVCEREPVPGLREADLLRRRRRIERKFEVKAGPPVVAQAAFALVTRYLELEVEAGITVGLGDADCRLRGQGIRRGHLCLETVCQCPLNQGLEILGQLASGIDARGFEIGWQLLRVAHRLGEPCPGQSLPVDRQRAFLANHFVLGLQAQHLDFGHQTEFLVLERIVVTDEADRQRLVFANEFVIRVEHVEILFHDFELTMLDHQLLLEFECL